MTIFIFSMPFWRLIASKISLCLLVCLGLVSCEKADFFEPKESTIYRFSFQVNTASPNSPSNFETDWGMLMTPKISSNKPIRLVLYCHSGSGLVTDSKSEAENIDFVRYFVSKGYAVLDVGGMPQTYAERIEVDPGRTLGSAVSLKAIQQAYEYVISNFNIAKNGCFIFSISNGGLLAGNVVNLTDIPVLAQSGVAPLLSLEKNAWHITSGPVYRPGFTSYQNRANAFRLFSMEPPIKTQNDLLNAKYQKDKVGVYDPFDYCINQSVKKYRTPYLIFTFKADEIVFYDIAKEFSEKMNKRGSKVEISDITEYGAHTAPANPIYVGNYSLSGQTLPLRLTVKTVGDFFDSYNPDLKTK